MKVRAASLDDCRAVADVHVASWQAAYAGILDPAFLGGLSIDRREQSWRQILAEGNSELLVGLEGACTVGFASLGASRDADALPGCGELMALYVHPRSWTTGVGRELWLAARNRLEQQGFSSVTLWVLERNLRAIGFYSAAGFTMDAGSVKDIDVAGTTLREVRMVRAS
ncbi:MAG TPA: GNAT family N-acetyltransferase [Ramlibacter sp.]|jgi:GNAT superfamily N-acetyltransferase|uniref:GNAT family N-acetyltransferase n=1 Tax=Ramlibacter sp. TaxID=1917967 RepID=UPI002D2BDA66|nr:GNAT family N-acetyltransferase [Ramlibacter sp.]HZY17535.1 GNAT family N-acetyltransferase [Ramlibacter sp.]